MMEPNFDAGTNQRIDVWLWCVRIFKTRSLATAAVRSGRVYVDGERIKAAHKVKIGQEVRIKRDGNLRVLVVQGFLNTRGSAPVAQACYVDNSPAPDPALRAPVPRRDKGLGRPTKKDRRALDKLRGRPSA